MPTRPSTPRPGVVAALLALATLLVCLPGAAFAEAKVSISAPMLPLARTHAIVPVHVDIATTDPVEGTIRVDFGNSTPGVVRRFHVGRGSVRRVSVPVRMPAWTSGIQVEVRAGRTVIGNTTLESPPPSAGVDQLHAVVIGEEPLGLTLLREVTGAPVPGHPGCSEPRPVRVETLLPPQLPAAWFGWTGADVVVWRRPDPSRLSPEQQTALRQWVHSGGTLVVALADNHGAWTTSPLGALSGLDVVPREPSEEVGRAVLDMGVAPGDAVVALPHLHLDPRSAWPRVEHDGATLVASRWVGAGRVVTLGFDPGAGELRGVLDRESFWRNLLALWTADGTSSRAGLAGPTFRRSPTPCGESSEPWNDNAASRRDNFRGRVFGALGAFSRANPLPFGTVLAFGLIYLLLIGPIDFLLGRRLRKPLLTWVTFPVIAIGFSVAAAVLISVRKAGDTEVRCVEVVDVFEGDVARGSGWCALWSNRRQDVVVSLERGVGAVRRAGGVGGADDVVQREESEVLAEATRVGLAWRANQWAVSTWSSAWVEDLPGGFELVDGGDGLAVRNQSGIDLAEAWLLQDGRAWALGPLTHGGTARPRTATSLEWGEVVASVAPSSAELAQLDAARPYSDWDNALPLHWTDAAKYLVDPHSEHVGRMPASRVGFELIGRAERVGAPLPELDAAVDTFALIRVALPDLNPEDLP